MVVNGEHAADCATSGTATFPALTTVERLGELAGPGSVLERGWDRAGGATAGPARARGARHRRLGS